MLAIEYREIDRLLRIIIEEPKFAVLFKSIVATGRQLFGKIDDISLDVETWRTELNLVNLAGTCGEIKVS